MTQTIAVCDNKVGQRAARMIDHWAQTHSTPTQVINYTSGAMLLDMLRHGDTLHMVLLDYTIATDILEDIRRLDNSLPVVLLTSAAESLTRHSRSQSIRALAQPLNQQAVSACMDSLCVRAAGSQVDAYIFETANEPQQVAYEDIIYFDINGRSAVAHTLTDRTGYKSFSFKKSISELQLELPAEFVRFNRTLIVNLHYAKAIRPGQLVLSDAAATQLPIHKDWQEALNQRFVNFQGQ